MPLAPAPVPMPMPAPMPVPIYTGSGASGGGDFDALTVLALVLGFAWFVAVASGGLNYWTERDFGSEEKKRNARKILVQCVLAPIFVPVWLPTVFRFLGGLLLQGVGLWLRMVRKAWFGEAKAKRGDPPDGGPYRTNGKES